MKLIEKWHETRTKTIDRICNILRFIGVYSATIITFGIPICICLDWYISGPEKWIGYMYQFYLLWLEHTILMITLFFMAIVVVIVVFVLVWRLIFPDYMKVIIDNETGIEKYPKRKIPNYEGRIYWITGWGLSAKIARWAGHELDPPEIRPVKIFVNKRGLLNIFVPIKSMCNIEGITAAQIERAGPWKIRIYEHGRYIATDTNELRIVDTYMEMTTIHATDSRNLLNNAIKVHVSDARSAAQADVPMAKEMMVHSTFSIPSDVWDGFQKPKDKGGDDGKTGK